eukprot:m.492090 g.492090  ORF g.492090 m.492090 type:complete len:54 (-) comp112743_c0_seq1:4-165(-)
MRAGTRERCQSTKHAVRARSNRTIMPQKDNYAAPPPHRQAKVIALEGSSPSAG